MTRDDKLLRETIVAELKRRRNLLGKDDEQRSDPADGRRVARPIYQPSPPAATTSE